LWLDVWRLAEGQLWVTPKQKLSVCGLTERSAEWGSGVTSCGLCLIRLVAQGRHTRSRVGLILPVIMFVFVGTRCGKLSLDTYQTRQAIVLKVLLNRHQLDALRGVSVNISITTLFLITLHNPDPTRNDLLGLLFVTRLSIHQFTIINMYFQLLITLKTRKPTISSCRPE